MKPAAMSNANGEVKITALQVDPLSVRKVGQRSSSGHDELSVVTGLVLTPQVLQARLPHIASVVQSTIQTAADFHTGQLPHNQQLVRRQTQKPPHPMKRSSVPHRQSLIPPNPHESDKQYPVKTDVLPQALLNTEGPSAQGQHPAIHQHPTTGQSLPYKRIVSPVPCQQLRKEHTAKNDVKHHSCDAATSSETESQPILNPLPCQHDIPHPDKHDQHPEGSEAHQQSQILNLIPSLQSDKKHPVKSDMCDPCTAESSEPHRQSWIPNPLPSQQADKQHPLKSEDQPPTTAESSELQRHSWIPNPLPSQQAYKQYPASDDQQSTAESSEPQKLSEILKPCPLPDKQHPAKSDDQPPPLTNSSEPFKKPWMQKLPQQPNKKHPSSDHHRPATARSSEQRPSRILNQFPCHICKERFPCRQTLNIHHLVHIEQHKCQKCDRSFKDRRRLLKHKCIICKHCSKYFNSMTTLNRHRCSEYKKIDFRPKRVNNTYSCTLCPAMFNNRRLFTRHVITHMNESIDSPDTDRTNHENRHNSEQSHNICEVCDMYFEDDFDLTTHMRYHKTVKSYCAVKKRKQNCDTDIENDTATVKEAPGVSKKLRIDQQNTFKHSSHTQFKATVKQELSEMPTESEQYSIKQEELDIPKEIVLCSVQHPLDIPIGSDPCSTKQEPLDIPTENDLCSVQDPFDMPIENDQCSVEDPFDLPTESEQCPIKQEELDIPKEIVLCSVQDPLDMPIGSDPCSTKQEPLDIPTENDLCSVQDPFDMPTESKQCSIKQEELDIPKEIVRCSVQDPLDMAIGSDPCTTKQELLDIPTENDLCSVQDPLEMLIGSDRCSTKQEPLDIPTENYLCSVQDPLDTPIENDPCSVQDPLEMPICSDQCSIKQEPSEMSTESGL